MATTRRSSRQISVPGGGGKPSGSNRQVESTFLESMQAAWQIPDLRRRILFVFAMFGIYMVGLYIPVPGINHTALNALFSRGGAGGGLLGMVNMFSGGALKQFTIFAMGIIPYINASIIMQLLTFAIPQWQEMSREGESGRRRIAQITRYGTVGLATLQAAGMGYLFTSQHILAPGIVSITTMMLTLVAGTSFLMWLGELISDKGIGNGVSLIIFCGIMARMPQQMGSVIAEVKSGTVNPLQALILVVSFFATVIAIVYMTLGQRRVPIQHVRRIVGNRMTQGGTSYLPFRVTSAGVIPIIFAVSIQLLPLTIAQYLPDSAHWGSMPIGHWVHVTADWFEPGKNWFTGLVYAGIIIFFTYFWTAVMMDIPNIAKDLKKYGSFVPGIRPGKPTEDYLDRVMTRITFAGALFLALVALMQYWIPEITNTGNAFTLVGGTSLLIVVGVALDTMQAIEAQLLMRHYEGFIR